MNGDWKDQKLNQHYQNDIRQQAAQDALVDNLQSKKLPMKFSLIQPLWRWFITRRPVTTQPIALSQRLKTVK
ncbi:MAG: hypothetical protein K8L97_03810 [Anaerolineae bacterium]|nr:hypothetical protein [Anaerolineae bacterium]